MTYSDRKRHRLRLNVAVSWFFLTYQGDGREWRYFTWLPGFTSFSKVVTLRSPS